MKHETAAMTVTVFAVFTWLGALVMGSLGILFLFFGPFLARILTESHVIQNLDTKFGTVAGFVLIVWAIGSLFVGIGLLKRKNNARIAFLCLALVVYTGSIIGGYGSKVQFWLFGLLAIVQFYLFGFQKEIVGLFKARSAPHPALEAHKRAA